MKLEDICKTGRMNIEDFFEFAVSALPMARRTHCLDVGDYVVFPDPFIEGSLLIEHIAGMDLPETGDFITACGAIGPINSNIFIKFKEEQYPGRFLIEGGNLNGGNCEVYRLVDRHISLRCNP